MAKKTDFDFASAMQQLEAINQWFQGDAIDLDKGLEKLKEGKDLILKCRQRLKEVENEFVHIKEDFSTEQDTVSTSSIKTPTITPQITEVDDLPF